MSTQQKLLEQLQLERDQRLLEQASIAIVSTPSDDPITTVATPVIDLVAEVDKLIAQRMKELDRFTSLAPQYNLLAQNVEQARGTYQHLLSKYSEAELKVTAVQAANFIQVIKPAYARPESVWLKLMVLALAGSLGLGVVLAFLLQYLSSFNTASAVAPVSGHKTASSRHRKKMKHSQASRVTEDHHNTPSRRYAGHEWWEHLKSIFRRHNVSNGHASLVPSKALDGEQEPIAAQD
jgi:hypothetical protein